ncbi:2TM domain-containing protein [Leptolyngbya sp. FACHB-17]|uniref:2TM domain-containing protein n=1 Tax=unclassified Leptolyngbya TaxID=2650499 RepID=UPI00168169CF|nr:2TM domain-containing protein [Leptolyngbya sp. FACHB-17]MBD2078721.1 2TM domain-containing protein [Leptolyngbya sp. FACHB-17]
MPPRWSRVPDRKDADYRQLDDRMTFATHVALFAATNSGIWFFRTLQQADWDWSIWVTSGWFAALVAHAIYVFAIADYSDTPIPATSKATGFKPKEKPSKSTKR